ncbi:MAG: hypothetical protein KDN20_15365 [Verrucomicrobiae bacterium]|nr:hypothetical protein [Verrucomicrobiae bacterium]
MSQPLTPTATQRLHFRPPDWKVTPTVDTIASACGISPELTGLIMTSIIGGLNQRYPSLARDITGNVPTGPNLLIIGADESPRLRRLLSMLLRPLIMKQSILRDAASNCRRDTLDLIRFGPEEGEDLNDPTKDILRRIKSGAFSDDSMGLGGRGRSNGRELVAANHPTIFLSNPAVDALLAGLNEAIDGQLLVFDEHGDLFRMLASPPRGDRSRSEMLTALLGQHGSDSIMRNLHARQGPGSLEPRQLGMISCVSRQQMVTFMEQKGVRSLLEQFIVVDATACPFIPDGNLSSKALSDAMHWWDQAMTSLYSARIAGMSCCPIPPERVADHLMHVMEDFHVELEVKAHDSPVPLGNLWSLPLQFYSALAIATNTGADGMVPVLPVLDGICERAAGRHVTALMRFQDEAASQERNKRSKSILRAIGRHGPCPFRVVVRTFSVQRKELYEPLVRELIDMGEVIEMDNGLLALPPGRRGLPERLEQRLN